MTYIRDPRVHVSGDLNYSDPLNQLTRLLFIDARGAVLMSDPPTWEMHQEGVATDPERTGLVIPTEYVEPLFNALARHLGHASHQATESAVLREWLAAERERNDRVFNALAGGPPRFVDASTRPADPSIWDQARQRGRIAVPGSSS